VKRAALCCVDPPELSTARPKLARAEIQDRLVLVIRGSPFEGTSCAASGERRPGRQSLGRVPQHGLGRGDMSTCRASNRTCRRGRGGGDGQDRARTNAAPSPRVPAPSGERRAGRRPVDDTPATSRRWADCGPFGEREWRLNKVVGASWRIASVGRLFLASAVSRETTNGTMHERGVL